MVVLVTPYGQSPADTRSPEALTVGRGEAFVFTDGNTEISLTPGQTWIELPRDGGVTLR